MKIRDWLEELEYEQLSGTLDEEVSEVCYDSRKAAPGAVFVCMAGTRVDSHRFAAQAVKAGAKVIVAERGIEKDLEAGGLTAEESARLGPPFRRQIWISGEEACHHRGNRNQGKDHHGPYDTGGAGSRGEKDGDDRNHRDYDRRRCGPHYEHNPGIL